MENSQPLTRDRFAENLNTYFQLVMTDGQAFQLKLAEVSELKQSTRTERFSVLFESPLDYFVSQGLYTLQHERMGTFDIFLVPVFKEETGYVYEALFNYLIDRK